jgi:hypothetical protein
MMEGVWKQTFIKVSFRISYARACKETRKIVHFCAANNCGMYLVGGKKNDTMKWKGNKLIVQVLFSTKEDACEFNRELEIALQPHTRSITLSQANFDVAVEVVEPPERITAADYDAKEYDFVECSFACDVDAIASTLSIRRPASELQHLMIENHEGVSFFQIFPYRAYLKSVAEFPDEEANPNNMLVMSWDVRQVFDGLVTPADYRVPLIAIRFVLNTGLKVPHENGDALERVVVAVESPEERWLTFFATRWAKAGSRYDERSRCVYTFLDVPNATEFERCLTYKYQHTQHVWWLQRPGMDLSPSEARELREAAHAAVCTERGRTTDPDGEA